MALKSIFLGCLIVITTIEAQDAINNKSFPANFYAGFASASYQIEGAWNEDGKGENVWDRASHSVPSPILNNDNGDVACDSYHKYKEDVAILKELGATIYRFSMSWSRILPTGYLNNVNQAGINYYKNLIKELKDNNIEPLVTMFHWDTPQPLQDMGGWLSEEIVRRFVEYANILFKNFGDDVKIWITFNEPKQTCLEGYGTAGKAPFMTGFGVQEYMCAHNLLKAHAEVWHLYQRSYREAQKGFVGITVDTVWTEANSTSEQDLLAAERLQHFIYGWYVQPITKGDYPRQMRQIIDERSEKQGFSRSRLPAFTAEEIQHIRGTVDFLGLNYYTAVMVSHKDDVDKTGTAWRFDAEINAWQNPEWPGSASSWLQIVPWGLRKALNWIKNEYGDIPIIITENGLSDDGTTLEDDIRIDYHRKHLSAILDAIDDGVNIFGYTAWSLMDNFEWAKGYSEKFGIYSVDFNDANRTRNPKKSAAFFKNFTATKCLVEVCENATYPDYPDFLTSSSSRLFFYEGLITYLLFAIFAYNN